MLSAVLIMAIVGGVLAFKAKKVDGICYYSSNTNINDCPFIGSNNTSIFLAGTPTYATTRLVDPQGKCDEVAILPCPVSLPTNIE